MNLRILVPDAMLLTTTLIYITDHTIPQIAYFKLVTENEFFNVIKSLIFIYAFMISCISKIPFPTTDYWGKKKQKATYMPQFPSSFASDNTHEDEYKLFNLGA